MSTAKSGGSLCAYQGLRAEIDRADIEQTEQLEDGKTLKKILDLSVVGHDESITYYNERDVVYRLIWSAPASVLLWFCKKVCIKRAGIPFTQCRLDSIWLQI